MEQNELNLYAKTLRKNMTEEEKHIWYDFLSSYPVKFRRQKVIGHYIEDFYCAKANLVIEIDGSSHANRQDYDGARDWYLRSLGLHVLRVYDSDVKENVNDVLRMVVGSCKEMIHDVPLPDGM